MLEVQGLKKSILQEQIEDPIVTLNKQWYNAIVTGCRLSDQQFQLMQ